MRKKQFDNQFKMDFHTHTSFSPDSKASTEEMVIEAMKRGITDLAFTDHVDIDADIDAHDMDWDFDRKAYEDNINALSDRYGAEINLYKGLEIGIQPHLLKENTAIVNEIAFDFVIASVHSVERHDLYHQKFFQRHTNHEAVRVYFEEMYKSLVSFDAYSVVGHQDLYLRYKPELEEIKLTAYHDIVSEIYKHLIYSGKGLEVNSGGFRYGLFENNPSDALLKLYRDMGGEIITLGSDAHTPEHLGFKYEENLERLKALGFKYICTFEGMKPIYHKI